MGSFRVAGASEYLAITGWGVDDVKLAKKAWVWLGQRCTTIDAVPASYELVAHGITAENFPVVLRAVCTVGPKTEYEVDPLLLRANAKLLAAPRRSNKELVEGVVEGRVRALAAAMSAEQVSAKGAAGFAKEALESAKPDLGKYGLRVYSATVQRLAVHVPAPANTKVSVVAAPAAMGLSVQVGHGSTTVSWSSKVEVVNLSVATNKAGSCVYKQTMVAGTRQQAAAVQIKMAAAQSLMAGGQSMMAGAQSMVAGGQSMMAGAQSMVAGGQSMMAGGQSMMAGAQSMVAGGQSMMAGAQSMMAGGQSMMAGAQSMIAGGQSMMLTPACLAGELPTERKMMQSPYLIVIREEELLEAAIVGSFRVAGASEYLAITGWGLDDVKLAKKAWVWLGQRCKTLDVAPASYEMEAQGVTSENFPVVLRVVYTVGPKIDDKNQLGDQEPPLLLYAKLVAPSKKKEDCSSRVKELVQVALDRHVGAVAAGMAADEILGEGWFAEDVLERVQPDLGKFGIRVYSANVKRLRVRVPARKYISDVVRKMTHLEEAAIAQVEPPRKGCCRRRAWATPTDARPIK
ncbi:hypothetical protein EJB05_32359, partial [Eragrostis curvula]